MQAPRWEAPSEDPRALRASPWWGIHASRYLFAAAYGRGRRILDVACGTGFGMTLLLEGGAGRVVGVDLDLGALTQATSAHRSRSGASVVQADGTRLPFAGASFEAVTSFETLEHLEQRKAFLSELRRVLAPSGVCLLSTPNANVTQPRHGKPANPYHVHEYTPAELLAELASHFSAVELLGQRLHPRFAVPPFWDEQQQLPRAVGSRLKLTTWRALNKLPVALRDRLSHTLLRQPFLPDGSDYIFSNNDIERAPVLVGLCRVGERG